jgi:hypothetical protein
MRITSLDQEQGDARGHQFTSGRSVLLSFLFPPMAQVLARPAENAGYCVIRDTSGQLTRGYTVSEGGRSRSLVRHPTLSWQTLSRLSPGDTPRQPGLPHATRVTPCHPPPITGGPAPVSSTSIGAVAHLKCAESTAEGAPKVRRSWPNPTCYLYIWCLDGHFGTYCQ